MGVALFWCSVLNAALPTQDLTEVIEARIEKMSPSQKAAMLMIIGIVGKKITRSTKTWIKKRGVGSVILFPKNIGSIEQIKNLTQAIQKLSQKDAVLIAIDQEGGRVRRIRKNVTFLPSAMTLGATATPSLSYLSGMVAGKELYHLGINVNLAPVLDIYHSKQDSLIGTRSFSPRTDTVSEMGSAYIRAIQNQGVSATAKHFPGHGAVTGDSHYTLPTSNIRFKRWLKIHMPPFQKAIDNNVDLLMTAHIQYPRMLKDLRAPKEEWNLPATMSPTLINRVLRKKLGYNGIVITDDLGMYAIKKKWTFGEAAIKAVLAGTDLVMVAWNRAAKNEVWNALTEAIKNKRISEDQVNASMRRILKLKYSKAEKPFTYTNSNILKNPHQQARAIHAYDYKS